MQAYGYGARTPWKYGTRSQAMKLALKLVEKGLLVDESTPTTYRFVLAPDMQRQMDDLVPLIEAKQAREAAEKVVRQMEEVAKRRFVVVLVNNRTGHSQTLPEIHRGADGKTAAETQASQWDYDDSHTALVVQLANSSDQPILTTNA